MTANHIPYTGQKRSLPPSREASPVRRAVPPLQATQENHLGILAEAASRVAVIPSYSEPTVPHTSADYSLMELYAETEPQPQLTLPISSPSIPIPNQSSSPHTPLDLSTSEVLSQSSSLENSSLASEEEGILPKNIKDLINVLTIFTIPFFPTPEELKHAARSGYEFDAFDWRVFVNLALDSMIQAESPYKPTREEINSFVQNFPGSALEKKILSVIIDRISENFAIIGNQVCAYYSYETSDEFLPFENSFGQINRNIAQKIGMPFSHVCNIFDAYYSDLQQRGAQVLPLILAEIPEFPKMFRVNSSFSEHLASVTAQLEESELTPKEVLCLLQLEFQRRVEQLVKSFDVKPFLEDMMASYLQNNYPLPTVVTPQLCALCWRWFVISELQPFGYSEDFFTDDQLEALYELIEKRLFLHFIH